MSRFDLHKVYFRLRSLSHAHHSPFFGVLYPAHQPMFHCRVSSALEREGERERERELETTFMIFIFSLF